MKYSISIILLGKLVIGENSYSLQLVIRFVWGFTSKKITESIKITHPIQLLIFPLILSAFLGKQDIYVHISYIDFVHRFRTSHTTRPLQSFNELSRLAWNTYRFHPVHDNIFIITPMRDAAWQTVDMLIAVNKLILRHRKMLPFNRL